MRPQLLSPPRGWLVCVSRRFPAARPAVRCRTLLRLWASPTHARPGGDFGARACLLSSRDPFCGLLFAGISSRSLAPSGPFPRASGLEEGPPGTCRGKPLGEGRGVTGALPHASDHRDAFPCSSRRRAVLFCGVRPGPRRLRCGSRSRLGQAGREPLTEESATLVTPTFSTSHGPFYSSSVQRLGRV